MPNKEYCRENEHMMMQATRSYLVITIGFWKSISTRVNKQIFQLF